MTQFLITALCAIGMLATVLTAAVLGLYMGRVPTGSNAMGLVVPFFLGIAAGLAALLAGCLLVAKGGLDGLGWSRTATFGAVAGAALLVGTAIVGALIAWAEAHWAKHPALLMFSGPLLPLAAFALTLFVSWNGVAALGPSALGKGLLLGTAGALAAGVVTAALLVQAGVAASLRQQARAAERAQQEQAEANRREALGPEGRLHEDLRAYSPDAPLWTLSSGLPGEPNPALRAIWIERALRHPSFDDELRRTLTTDYGIYRHGAAFLIADMPAERLQPQAWLPWLATDARMTAADIRKLGDLKEHEHDPLAQHVQTIARAAARLGRTPALDQALMELRAAVLQTADDPARAAALASLDRLKPAP